LRLRDAGKCILFSSHIMREVEKLCDRVAIMHRGRVLEEDSLHALRSRSGVEDLEDLFFNLINRAEKTGLTSPRSWPVV
jgi:sodium transport system ATP-binding protein